MSLASLYDNILQNSSLQFLDARTGIIYPVGSFHHSFSLDDQQGLVFVYSDNQIGTVEVLLNFLRSRYTVCLLSTQLHSSFKESLEKLYRPYYIYDPVRSEVQGYTPAAVSPRIRLMQRRHPSVYPIHPNIKLLLSTSGTTGSPKLVKLSNDNLVQNALSILDYMPIRSEDIVPLQVPIVFVYGLSILTTNCMRAGTIVCTEKELLQKEFWEEALEHRYTTIGGVPYVYEMLHRIGFFKQAHPGLRYMTQTGGMLNKTLVQEIGHYAATHGVHFYAQYGQTEAAGRMAWLPPADLLRKAGSIGLPIKNGRFSIDEGTQELIYYGPNVSGGYATSPADLADYHYTPQLYTGDLARQDEDGYYYITGRIKRIIKLFGTRINLDEVELILKNSLGGQTFACLGIDDKYLSVLHVNDSIREEQVKQVLKEKLQIHPRCVLVQCNSQLPLTPNGKIDYTKARMIV